MGVPTAIDPEIVESTPDSEVRPSSPAVGKEAAPCPTARCEAPPGDASGPQPANPAYNPPEAWEIAPIITVRTPTETPGEFRLVKMRMVRNGWMGCG